MGWLSIFRRRPAKLDQWEVAENQDDPVPGEVWRMNCEENPFHNPHYDVVILDVKDGWVQYDRGGSPILRIDQKKIRSFKWIYKRLVPVKVLDADQPA